MFILLLRILFRQFDRSGEIILGCLKIAPYTFELVLFSIIIFQHHFRRLLKKLLSWRFITSLT